MKKVGSAIVKGLMRLLSLLPLKVHYFLCRGLSFLCRSVFRYRWAVVMTNLARSFPQAKAKEIKTLFKQFYRHFGDIIAEAIWFGRFRSKDTLRKQAIVSIENPEELNRIHAIAPGAVILSSHFGNWELLGGLFAYTDRFDFTEDDFCVVYKKLTSSLWDDIMGRNRQAYLNGTGYEGYLESKDALRYALSHKGEHKMFVFPSDQHPYAYATKHRVDDFLHQPTWTMTGGTALAAKLGLAVIYLSMKKREDGGYSIKFTTLTDNASGTAPEEIMNDYYKLLQRDIEAQPWNYLWSHNRWKS